MDLKGKIFRHSFNGLLRRGGKRLRSKTLYSEGTVSGVGHSISKIKSAFHMVIIDRLDINIEYIIIKEIIPTEQKKNFEND